MSWSRVPEGSVHMMLERSLSNNFLTEFKWFLNVFYFILFYSEQQTTIQHTYINNEKKYI